MTVILTLYYPYVRAGGHRKQADSNLRFYAELKSSHGSMTWPATVLAPD